MAFDLLVCVFADGQAMASVDHAARLMAGSGGRWKVLHIDSLAARYAGAAVVQDLSQAIRHAEAHGAEVVHASLGLHAASHILALIAEHVRQSGASTLVIGSNAVGDVYWLGEGARLSDFAESLSGSLPSVLISIVVAPASASAGQRGAAAVPRPGRMGWRAALRPLVALGLATAVSFPISTHLHPINLLLIYLVAVLFVALRQGGRAAIATAVGAVLLFDWIFVPPRWSLKPTEPEYFFTFGIMLGVGWVVSRLAGQARDTAAAAVSVAERTQVLNLLAQDLANARTTEEVCDVVVRAVGRAVGGLASLHLGPQVRESTRDLALAVEPGPSVRLPLGVSGAMLGWIDVKDIPPIRQTAEDAHLLRSMSLQIATALARLEAESANRSIEVAAEAERVRNTLLTSISHDFRTPLTAIIGAATTLLEQRGRVSVQQECELLTHVLEHAHRLRRLCADLLDMARLQDGAVQLAHEWCPAGDLLREALASTDAARAGIGIEVIACEDDLVWCDPRLIVQALGNLVLNALQHAPRGSGITLSVAREADRWRFTVRDRGPGLPPGQEAMVFQKFHRYGSGTPGTGLGLAICRLVAQLHGGSITARNEGGAVFELRIPATAPAPALAEETSA